MIIHITREIRQVIIYGANGSEAAVREFFHQHEVDNMVVCRPNDDEYLASVEFGNEVATGTGETVVKRYTISIQKK